MATGSGLDSYLATVNEVTVGTLVSPPTNFFPFTDAELTFDPSYIDNAAIMNGVRFKDVNQASIARKAATGKLSVPVMMNGFGFWLKHMIGSTAVPAADGESETAFKQIHVPAGLKGKSFTAQIGKPQPSDGVVKIKTYNGCKLTDWDLTFSDNEITTLDATVDAFDEDGTHTIPTITYPTGGAFNFAHVTTFATITNNDGTKVTATDGLMAIDGAAVTVPSVVTELTLSGKASLATDRYGLGNAGTKKEQLETDFFEITGAFKGEYDVNTWEVPFVAGDTVAIHVASIGPDIDTDLPYMIDIIIPAAKITKAPAPVSGPDIVSVSGEFTVYDPKQTGIAPIQFVIRSTDDSAF